MLVARRRNAREEKKDYSKLTNNELKLILSQRGIHYTDKAIKKDLIALIEEGD